VCFFYKRKPSSVAYGKTYLIAFCALTVVIIAGVFATENISTSIVSLTRYMTAFAFAKILIDECVNDKNFPASVSVCLSVALTISFFFLIGQFIWGTGFTFERSENANVLGGANIRYTSFFQDPQKYAQFIAICSFMMFITAKKRQRINLWNSILCSLALLAMMYTGGRAALAGWCLGAVIILLFGDKKLRLILLPAGLALFVLLNFFGKNLSMFNRLDSLDDDYAFRYSIWLDAVDIFKTHPMLGIGIGNYAEYVALHNPDQVWTLPDNNYSYFDHPESGYLKFLTEFGAFGFISICIFIFFPVIKGFFVYLKTRDLNTLLSVAAVVAWLVAFYTLYSLDDTRIRVLVITAICILITSIKTQGRNASH